MSEISEKSKKYVMSLDVGTQSTTVMVHELNGDVVCEGRRTHKAMSLPAPGAAEHPDDDLWDAVVEASNICMNRFHELKLDIKDIASIGICFQRCCRVLLKENGELAFPVISWMDRRLGCNYEHLDIYKDVRYVGAGSAYLTHRLIGEFKDTCANYIGCWPMDGDTWDWSTDPEVIKSFNIPREMLVDVYKPGTIVGKITAKASGMTGLPEGLNVVCTAHDKAVETLGGGVWEDGAALVSFGTYICSVMPGKVNIVDTTNFWTFFGSAPDSFIYESHGIRRGMWTVSWFKNQFGDAVLNESEKLGISILDYLNMEGSKIPAGCDGLITVHDFLAPVDKIYRKGAMIGFDGRHTRAHIFRSILEGLAFTMKNHLDRACVELKYDLKKLIITGGGSYSNLLMQICADVFNVPVFRNKVNDACSLGCAIDAAVASNIYPDFDTAIKSMVHVKDSFKPNPENAKFYASFNKEAYDNIQPMLDPILKRISKFVD